MGFNGSKWAQNGPISCVLRHKNGAGSVLETRVVDSSWAPKRVVFKG